MKAKHSILRCFSITFTLFYFIQNGIAQPNHAELHVFITELKTFSGSKFSYSIYHDQKLVNITRISSKDNFDRLHGLNCGVYKIELYKNDSLFMSFDNIQIECETAVQFHLNLNTLNHYTTTEKKLSGTTSPNKPLTRKKFLDDESVIILSHGNRNLYPDTATAFQLYRFGYGLNIRKGLNNHFAIGYEQSLACALSFAKRNEFIVDSIHLGKERYTYFSYGTSVFFRYTFKNQYTTRSRSAIDFGITYQIPLYFRHILIYSNRKTAIRYLHRWNDLEAYFRLQIKDITLFGAYRLFDYVKFNYPQNPKITVGIHFLIDM